MLLLTKHQLASQAKKQHNDQTIGTIPLDSIYSTLVLANIQQKCVAIINFTIYYSRTRSTLTAHTTLLCFMCSSN